MQEDLNNIIESLLFVSEEPLTVDKLKNILETVEAKEIRSALETLAQHYESRGGGFKLAAVAGGWQLRSRPEYNKWIKRMLQPSPQRLSKAALETLAIIAYNQPIIRADIEHIRGVDAGGVLRQLMERKLIRVLGRKEIPGRPLIYATTKLFLEIFELRDLKDLPSPKEIEEMSAEKDAVPIVPMPDPQAMALAAQQSEKMTLDLPEIGLIEKTASNTEVALHDESNRHEKSLGDKRDWLKTQFIRPGKSSDIAFEPAKLPRHRWDINTHTPKLVGNAQNSLPGRSAPVCNRLKKA